jgi:hypothetical protein
MQVAFVKAAWKAKRDGKSFDATATLKALKSRKPKVEAVETPDVTPIDA